MSLDFDEDVGEKLGRVGFGALLREIGGFGDDRFDFPIDFLQLTFIREFIIKKMTA